MVPVGMHVHDLKFRTDPAQGVLGNKVEICDQHVSPDLLPQKIGHLPDSCPVHAVQKGVPESALLFSAAVRQGRVPVEKCLPLFLKFTMDLRNPVFRQLEG